MSSNLSHDNGKLLAEAFHAGFKAGFPNNDHADSMKDLLSSSVVVDWSDGFRGTKTPTEIFDHLGKSWGMMVSSILWDPSLIIDTTNGKVVMMGQLVVNIDGKLDKAHCVMHPLCFVLGFDEDGKCSSWTGYWDNANPDMLDALGKVMEALKSYDEFLEMMKK
jgi:hypothetical protein